MHDDGHGAHVTLTEVQLPRLVGRRTVTFGKCGFESRRSSFTLDAALTWRSGAAAGAGGDRQRRPGSEEASDEEHPQADPEHRVELGADAHVGGHTADE